jgi:hypothetical protein
MLKFLIKLFIIVLICSITVILYLNYSYLKTERILGPNTKHQIEQSFNNLGKERFDLLFIGNSRLYRGINPDSISAFKAYNFSYDGDSFLQTYYKLKYIEEHKINFKYAVISADYFSFSLLADNSNSNYYHYFNNSYKTICNGELKKIPVFKSDKKKENSSWRVYKYMDNLNDDFNQWITKNINNSAIQFIKGLKSTNADKPFLKPSGQYIVNSKAGEEDFLERSSDVYTPLQNYLDSILLHCTKNNIKVFLAMLPTRKNELKNYKHDFQNNIDNFYKSLTDNKNVFYLNYKNDSTYKLEDFSDLTHFSVKGADRFSKQITKDLRNKLDSLYNNVIEFKR